MRRLAERMAMTMLFLALLMAISIPVLILLRATGVIPDP